MSTRKISRALVSVFYKDNLEPIIKLLVNMALSLYQQEGRKTSLKS